MQRERDIGIIENKRENDAFGAEKNRTGSEGGEKARYPSPVVGKKIKENGAQCLWVWELFGKLSPQ